MTSIATNALHERLSVREKPLRGIDLHAKLSHRDSKIDQNKLDEVENRVQQARSHNKKVEAAGTASVAKMEAVLKERNARAAASMEAHTQRRNEELVKISAKGTMEINKVASAVAKIYDAEDEKAFMLQIDQKYHEAKRQEQLDKTSAKGAAVSKKVEAAA